MQEDAQAGDSGNIKVGSAHKAPPKGSFCSTRLLTGSPESANLTQRDGLPAQPNFSANGLFPAGMPELACFGADSL